jgi:aryl-alcohol dehydrogenase-like predicted oxidoreductase
MTFGSGELKGIKLTIDQKKANEMVGIAIESGINLFDTADMYGLGQSEKILGKALGNRRKDFIIATKFGFRMSDKVQDIDMSRQHIMASAEASLKRLGTDYIDLYQVHFDDMITPLEELVSALDNLVQRGLVRYLGFSNFNAWKAATAIQIQKRYNYTEFVSSQMYYSLLGRDLESEFVPFANYYNLGIMVWSPLVGGFLSGKYSRKNPVRDGGRLSTSDLIPFDRETGYKLIEVLKKIANRHNASPAQVSIAWLLSKPYITSVVVGASKVKHFEENIKSNDLNLTPAELKKLDEMTTPNLPYPNWKYTNMIDPALEKALSEE